MKSSQQKQIRIAKGNRKVSSWDRSGQLQEEEDEPKHSLDRLFRSQSVLHNLYVPWRLRQYIVFNNKSQLQNVSKLTHPYIIEGLYGSKVSYQYVGDHPLLGKV